MDLSYSEEQLLLRDSAEKFLSAEYDFATRQKIAASPDGFSPVVWRQFAELGFLALPLAEDAGGLGGGPVELGLLMETFGKALIVEPYLATIILGAGAIAAAGDDGQRAAILPGVAEGAIRLAFAHSERQSRYVLSAVGTTAQRQGNGWRLDGDKICVLGAVAADQLIVSARISGAAHDANGIGLFLIPSDISGLSITPYPLIDGSRAGDVTLNGVLAGDDALLGGSDDALPVIERLMDHAIIALAADAVGALNVLLDATVDYAKTRVQFGQPIGKFQALQHRMAEMAVEAEEARGIMLFATLMVDAAPNERARAASAAKVKVGRAARHIAEQAIQLHGAMGVTEELNIGAYLKRILVFELLFGSIDHHLRRYSALARETGFIAQGLIAERSAA